MKSVQHHYAATALACIENIKSTSLQQQQQYGSLCHRFPSMVMLNGLRLTVTFFSSDKGMRSQYLDDISRALNVNLRKQIPDEMDKYRLLTRQVLAASVWYKRYAEAILGVTQSDAVEEERDES
ncbi:type III-B CRISPR module-associated protein Cmr5 [Paenibacillus sp. GCM10012307]|uniref:CRISPR type III-B/RAMP module-associated protein Cmr5 n=1 Tax=Paenibacillus roseus TaxID=2798579 RepID=A0A934MSG9_9BACL|nr:type III-B CRISPR module-associated protein Cmr5 [Paenibacillus roseus]MBJ6363923.1 type III-B CRISPR module-associated protein Cmr5 [Paenibacillus roseus]